MSDPQKLTIGQVLKDLNDEFPDVTVSKIRFLETEGLVEPDRSASGYRKFSPNDVARLRYILRLQRDHYMPLKVIRQRLERFDPSEESATDIVSGNGASAQSDGEEDLFQRQDAQATYSLEDLANSSGLDTFVVQELSDYGVISPASNDDEAGETYDESALTIAKVAKEFAKFGIEPRHLKMYRNFTDRESDLFEQAVLPRVANPAAERQVSLSLRELSRLSRRIKQALLVGNLRQHLTR